MVQVARVAPDLRPARPVVAALGGEPTGEEAGDVRHVPSLLLERGFGRPPQAIEHSGSIASVAQLPTDDLKTELEDLLRKL